MDFAAGNGTRRDPDDNHNEGVVPIEDWPLTALLRGARAAFGSAIRRALAGGGYDDLPPNGPYVIGAIARSDAARSDAARSDAARSDAARSDAARTSAPLAAVVRQLGVSKQAAGQLVDTLVIRGYLHRSVDPVDRRRLVVGLTDRGAAAAAVIRTAADAVEAELQATVGVRRVQATREVLANLVRQGASSQEMGDA